MINVELDGLDDVVKDLSAYPADIDAALINGLNRGATWGRQQIVQKDQVTGVPKRTLMKRIAIHRARRNTPVSTIAPSSAAIPVEQYRFTIEPVGTSPTRARIKVGWFSGDKIAAGFSNPRAKSGHPIPLSTRSAKGITTPHAALGPSAAAMFKPVVDDQLLADIQLNVEQYIADSLQKRAANRQPISVESS